MFISTPLREDDRLTLLEYYKTLVAVKPERNPPRLLTDTTDGIHPIYAQDYLRRICKSNN
jgi:hypothetical protein